MPKRCALLVMFLSLLGLPFAANWLSAQEVQQEGTLERTALVLPIDGAIGPATADYIARSLRVAAERGAPLVILRMDTPGGLDSSMREIIRAILASPVPVATYVSPSGARAASAGTYILYASHIAAMTPGTHTGAATPVAIGGGWPLPGDKDEKKDEKAEDKDEEKKPVATPAKPAEAKAINDAVAYIRGLAELRGRNADWAERAVREAASISAAQALKENVIDIVATDVNDLLAQANGRSVRIGQVERVLDTKDLQIERIEPDWRTRLLSTITNPNVALILMMIGIYGLLFEFMNPGSLVPGTVGAISLLVALYALALLPVNYAGVALMLLGVALMIAEAFAPSFGILGIGGVVSFVLGAAILVDTEAPGFEISWAVIGAVAVASIAFTLLAGRLAISSFRRRIVSGAEELIGASGEVQDWRGGKGHVFAHGERWSAVSEAPLQRGERVCVVGREGLTLKVAPAGTGEN